MNGFITRALTVACLGVGLTTLGGCKVLEYFYDPCYPERYEAEARKPVIAAFATQACNGHVLDQTVWNAFFNDGTAELTPGGQQYLDYLARRRPHPDTKLFLQTAYDIKYEPKYGAGELPEVLSKAQQEFVNKRAKLDQERVVAVQAYLQANTAGRPMVWEVAVHDPSPVGMSATPVGLIIQRHYASAQGFMPSQGTGPGLTSGGPTGPSSR